MSRIFITGSTSGLGLLTGRALLDQGHRVLFHARNAARADELKASAPEATILVADLANLAQTGALAEQVKALGDVDSVIHNAGVFPQAREADRADIPATLAVNLLAPYVLTSLLPGAKRHVYLSSSMHRVRPVQDDMPWRTRPWNASSAYSESKFYLTAFAMAVARKKPDVKANAVDPGWVPTRMGGRHAPDDLDAGYQTQVALVSTPEILSDPTGAYLHHMMPQRPSEAALETPLQESILSLCEELTGVAF